MAISKIILNNVTQMDITDTTATASEILEDYTAYGADGTKIIGAATGESGGTNPAKFLHKNQSGYIIFDSEVPESSELTLDAVAERDFGTMGAVTLPTATFIAPYTFYNQTSMTSFSAPLVEIFKLPVPSTGTYSGSTGAYVFAHCTNLTSVNLPSLTAAGSGGYQFYKCTSLVNAYMPNTWTGQHMFDGCTSLQVFVSTSTGNMNGNGFLNCTALTAVDLGTAKIGASEFSGATNLNTIILRNTNVVTIANINAFNNTPFASGKAGGTIYIPESLYEHLGDGTASDYQSATNWSTIHGYGTITWAKIEGSIYETKYADGNDIPTT